MKPTVGRVVYYVSHGSPVLPDGTQRYTPEYRGADVTEVDPDDPDRVGLMVKNPTGLFFYPLECGGVLYDEDRSPGTWHWPPRTG